MAKCGEAAYYAAVATGVVWVLVHAVVHAYTAWQGVLAAAAFGWALLVFLCMWPSVSTLLPREEVEQGWRVKCEKACLCSCCVRQTVVGEAGHGLKALHL